jgi:integrase
LCILAKRAKRTQRGTFYLTGRELRALRRLEREATGSPFVFVSERRAPFSTRGFQAMVERAAQAAGFDMKIHPHMLRHACGYKLANEGVDTRTIQGYLGHKSIQHTCATLSWRRRGSRVFGATSHPKRRWQTPALLAIVEEAMQRKI